MSFMKEGRNCFERLKIQSAKGYWKSISNRHFKKLEDFYIKRNDGVIFDWRMQKNYPKNVEYFKNILCYLA